MLINPSHHLSILQWNILDPEFGLPKDFPLVDEQFLSWTYRQTKIIEIIQSLAPDVFCLEEVKQNHGFNFSEYQTFYLEKKSLSHGLFVGYKRDRFHLIHQHTQQFEYQGETQSQNFIYLRLKQISTGNEINLIVTHLKSKKFPEVRLQSVNQLLTFIAKQNIQNRLIICGDLNSEENETCIIQLVKGLKVDSIRKGIFTTFKKSAANNLAAVKRKIDYIFYDPKYFKLQYDWSLDKEVENLEHGCPSKECPSDHLPLFAIFEPVDPEYFRAPNL